MLAGVVHDEDLAPSDTLLLLNAFDHLGDRDAVPVIQALLRRAEETGCEMELWGGQKGDSASFRHLIVIRAAEVLMHLGCADARDWLTPYLSDSRLTVRRFARRVAEVGESL